MTKRILLLLIFSLCLIAAKAAEPTILNISNIDLGDDPFRDYQFTSPSLSSFIIVHPKQTYDSNFDTSDNAYKLYKIDTITANASLI